MNPSRTTRKKTEITNRRQQVAERYLRGMYMAQIAEELGVDTATISRDLSELRKEWLDRSINHVEQKKADELARIDQLERTYWDAWERSKENAKTITKKKTPAGDISERKTEGQVGNPAFLTGVQWCINKRCEILGLEAPKRSEITGKDGESIVFVIKERASDGKND